MKIIVDMMGGDNAPLAVLEGAAQAVKEYGITVVGVGDEALVRKTAQENSIPLDGIELVTEGVLTLNRVIQLLKRYVKNETVSEEFFLELDKPNGASMVAKMLIEDCTELHLYVGKAINLSLIHI